MNEATQDEAINAAATAAIQQADEMAAKLAATPEERDKINEFAPQIMIHALLLCDMNPALARAVMAAALAGMMESKRHADAYRAARAPSEQPDTDNR